MASITQILHMNRSGMLARLLDLDQVSNNLANINTTGFKSSRSNFQEMMNNQRYGGVQLRATQRFMDQGVLEQTGNPLDLAINGEGFFAVTLPDGRTGYTRDGEFTLDAERRIVNASGYPLVWDGQVPEDAVRLNVYPDGTVTALQGDTWNQIGQIQINSFPNENGLQGYGQNLWLETEVSGAVLTGAPNSDEFGSIVSGSLELSNVNIANEMTQMITLQRSFEMSLETFKQTDQMLSQAIHLRR